jgi:hypothetical protein
MSETRAKDQAKGKRERETGEKKDVPHNQHSMGIPTPRPERDHPLQRKLIKVMNHRHLLRIEEEGYTIRWNLVPIWDGI